MAVRAVAAGEMDAYGVCGRGARLGWSLGWSPLLLR